MCSIYFHSAHDKIRIQITIVLHMQFSGCLSTSSCLSRRHLPEHSYRKARHRRHPSLARGTPGPPHWHGRAAAAPVRARRVAPLDTGGGGGGRSPCRHSLLGDEGRVLLLRHQCVQLLRLRELDLEQPACRKPSKTVIYGQYKQWLIQTRWDGL